MNVGNNMAGFDGVRMSDGKILVFVLEKVEKKFIPVVYFLLVMCDVPRKSIGDFFLQEGRE